MSQIALPAGFLYRPSQPSRQAALASMPYPVDMCETSNDREAAVPSLDLNESAESA